MTAFAAVGDFDIATFRSCVFEMEWPPHSGRMAEFPEVDRAEWFSLADAAEKIHRGQRPILDAIAVHLGETTAVTRR